MKKIYVADMTLGAGIKFLPASPGFKDKLEAARDLDKLGADVIEFAGIEDAKIDSLLIRTVCSFIRNSTVSLCAGISIESVEAAWAAVSGALNPRLSVELPLSPAMLEYSCKLKPADAVALVKKLVSKCVGLGAETEFRALDATRAESDLLKQAICAAISAGAKVITVCDNEGCSMPCEIEKFIKKLYADIPDLKNVKLGYLCENTYGLALSSSLVAAKHGAEEIKTAIGLSRYATPDALAEIIRNRGKNLGFTVSLNQTELGRISRQVSRITTEQKTKISAAKTDFAGLQETKLTSGATAQVITDIVKKLGYTLEIEDEGKVYDAFVRITAKKKEITVPELEAIIANVANDAPQTYKLASYAVTSSSVIRPQANIALTKGDEKLEAVSLGDGPIDAAFRAIEQITGRSFELDDFQITAVTEGSSAMGSALVKLREGGKLYSGQGISTDIIGSSIRAYLSAVNKIIYEESK